ncbi:hypothetical protein EXN66_Car022111 [Channa argus]|uniref:Uncharacterized protein n=1 Tax=Channa argus TaxID=215402 RepID=A0A6G1QVS0_CHAAH|nr:hypothetical protein EXN66_Car022111 [Channa argus]
MVLRSAGGKSYEGATVVQEDRATVHQSRSCWFNWLLRSHVEVSLSKTLHPNLVAPSECWPAA